MKTESIPLLNTFILGQVILIGFAKKNPVPRFRLLHYTAKSSELLPSCARAFVLHSDEGAQYASKEYYALSEKYGFSPSMSRKATPLDNACAENFFSILKAECVNRHTIKTFSEAKLLILHYIYFYNHERIQLSFACSALEKRRQAA